MQREHEPVKKKLIGCKYLEWLANVVLMKKPSGKWRMCVDFTDLNKTCLKDDYLLRKLDKLVDSTVGHAL